jgi:hypothetical protein
VIAVEVSPLAPDEFRAAVGVLARGMRDNPIHVAVFGTDVERRVRLLARMFTTLTTMDNTPLAARRDGEVVGVLGMVAWPACMPSLPQIMRFAPLLATGGPVTGVRMGRWLQAWSRRDPAERHSHLGPVAVDMGLQRHGVGGQMMAGYCSMLVLHPTTSRWSAVNAHTPESDDGENSR